MRKHWERKRKKKNLLCKYMYFTVSHVAALQLTFELDI